MPFLFLALLVLAEPNLAETRLSGYVKSTLLVNKVEKTPQLDFPTSYEAQNNFRIMLDGFKNNLSWEVHYEMTPIFSSRNLVSSSFETGNSAYRTYDLDKILSSNKSKNKTYQNLDRLNVQFQFDDSDLTIGRQSIDLGSARMIKPTDIFLPFNLQTLNTEYRIGVDAFRYQTHLSELSEIDVGVIFGSEGKSENSAAYLRIQTNFRGADLKVSMIEYARQTLYSFGIETAINKSGFWFEVADVQGDEHYTLVSLGLDRALSETLFAQIEYHHNGAGTDDPSAYTQKINEIAYRKGGVTLFGNDYFLPSISAQISPLLNLSFGAVFNLTDNSSFISLLGEWSATENFYIDLGWYHFSGRDFLELPSGTVTLGSEYGLNSDLVFTTLKYYF